MPTHAQTIIVSMKSRGETPVDCLSELVDNSDAANAEHIDTILDKNNISVFDDGDGMTMTELQDAMAIKQNINNRGKTISGLYGIGMKIGLFGFVGPNCPVSAIHIITAKNNIFSFGEFVNGNSGTQQFFDDKSKSSVFKLYKNLLKNHLNNYKCQSGTLIIIDQTTEKQFDIDSILVDIGKIFTHWIQGEVPNIKYSPSDKDFWIKRRKLQIRINGKLCVPQPSPFFNSLLNNDCKIVTDKFLFLNKSTPHHFISIVPNSINDCKNRGWTKENSGYYCLRNGRYVNMGKWGHYRNEAPFFSHYRSGSDYASRALHYYNNDNNDNNDDIVLDIKNGVTFPNHAEIRDAFEEARKIALLLSKTVKNKLNILDDDSLKFLLKLFNKCLPNFSTDRVIEKRKSKQNLPAGPRNLNIRKYPKRKRNPKNNKPNNKFRVKDIGFRSLGKDQDWVIADNEQNNFVITFNTDSEIVNDNLPNSKTATDSLNNFKFILHAFATVMAIKLHLEHPNQNQLSLETKYYNQVKEQFNQNFYFASDVIDKTGLENRQIREKFKSMKFGGAKDNQMHIYHTEEVDDFCKNSTKPDSENKTTYKEVFVEKPKSDSQSNCEPVVFIKGQKVPDAVVKTLKRESAI